MSDSSSKSTSQAADTSPPKPLVIVVHGIGKHTAESIKKEVVDACNYSLKSYPTWKKYHGSNNIEDFVEIVGVGYDDIFEAERESMATNAKLVTGILSDSYGFPVEVVKKISDVEDDNFATTHALDVLLYGNIYSAQVRSRVAGKISELLANRDGRDIHIVGHSMGTAVLNDTIHKMYAGGIVDEDGVSHHQSAIDDPINSVWMFANFSDAFYKLNPLKVNVNPKDSLIKPSIEDQTPVKKFYNVEHKFDPSRLKGFHPKKEDKWVDDDSFDLAYLYIRTEALIETLNPHSLFGYIIDPNVRPMFLKTILPSGMFNVPPSEIKEVHAAIKDRVSEAQGIIDLFDRVDSPKDFVDWVKLIIEFYKEVKELDF